MTTLATFKNSAPFVIAGSVVTTPRRKPKGLREARGAVQMTGTRGILTVTIAGEKIFLRRARVIVRESGRHRRHLSRYLVGFDDFGRLVEVFLGVVKGFRSAAFRLTDRLRQGIFRLTAKLTGHNVRLCIERLTN